MIFDSHAHYDDEAFNEDREAILNSLPKNGISPIVNVSAQLSGVTATVELTEKYPFIYGSVGVHPDHVGELSEEKIQWMKELAGREKIVAVGEIGLDHYWDTESDEVQRKWFIRQLELAKEVNLPVIIHSREASQETFDIMKEHHSQKIIVILCHSQSDPVHCKHHRMNNIGPALGTFLSVMKPNGRLQCHSTLLHMMFFDVLPQILLHIRSFLVKL